MCRPEVDVGGRPHSTLFSGNLELRARLAGQRLSSRRAGDTDVPYPAAPSVPEAAEGGSEWKFSGFPPPSPPYTLMELLRFRFLQFWLPFEVGSHSTRPVCPPECEDTAAALTV